MTGLVVMAVVIGVVTLIVPLKVEAERRDRAAEQAWLTNDSAFWAELKREKDSFWAARRRSTQPTIPDRRRDRPPSLPGAA